jgi:hypothetical protein
LASSSAINVSGIPSSGKRAAGRLSCLAAGIGRSRFNFIDPLAGREARLGRGAGLGVTAGFFGPRAINFRPSKLTSERWRAQDSLSVSDHLKDYKTLIRGHPDRAEPN